MAVFVLNNYNPIRTFEKIQLCQKIKRRLHRNYRKDADGNYFCGEYLLDYQYTEKNFKVGDEINIKSVIVNPSDKSYNQYPKNREISFSK